MRETLFFFQRQIRMNCALDTSNSTSQPCLYHFCPTASSFLLKVHKRWRSTLSPKKLLTIPLDIWKTLLTFLKKTFVGNPNLFWLNFLKFFPGSFERTNFSPKDHFWRKEKLLKSLLKKTHEKPNFDHSIKKIVENKLLVENAFHKMFLWTRKLQFWETCGKHPPNIRIFFSFNVQKRENSLFAKKFHQTFLWTHRKHFSQRCEKHNKPQKYFAESPSFFQKLSQFDDWWNFTKNINLTENLHRARKRNFDEVVSLVCLTASRFF